MLFLCLVLIVCVFEFKGNTCHTLFNVAVSSLS